MIHRIEEHGNGRYTVFSTGMGMAQPCNTEEEARMEAERRKAIHGGEVTFFPRAKVLK